MAIREEIIKESCLIIGSPNYLKIKTVSLDTSSESVKKFNKIFFWCKKQKNISFISWTSSGGLSLKQYIYNDCWGYRVNGWLIELCIILYDEDDNRHGVRYQFGRGEPKLGDRTGGYSGRKAIARAKKDALKLGFDLDDLAIKNGLEVKKTIPKPLIWVDDSIIFRKLEKVHHIDFHSSHPFGMFEAFPILEPMIRLWYDMRHYSDQYKNQLVMFWGALQSKALCGAKWSHIAKAGIESTNRRVLEMVERLKKNNRKVICLNTDGIWYQGDIFHGEGEGEDIGQWTNDHIDCVIRFKSRGSYEYIENDQYTPVSRGRTNLDNIKPRENWEWGDIFHEKCVNTIYKFTKDEGIIPKTQKEIEEDNILDDFFDKAQKRKLDKIIKNL